MVDCDSFCHIQLCTLLQNQTIIASQPPDRLAMIVDFGMISE